MISQRRFRNECDRIFGAAGLTLAGLLLLSGSVGGQDAEGEPSPPPPPAPSESEQTPDAKIREELGQLQGKVQEINDELYEISRQAEESEQVAEALKEFQTTVFEGMVSQAPDLEEEIGRYAALTRELQSNEELNKAPEERKTGFQAKLDEYQDLRKELLPVQRQVLQAKEVQTLHQEYQELLLDQMSEIEPETEELIEQRKQLSQEMQNLQKALQQLRQQGGNTPQPPPQPDEGP